MRKVVLCCAVGVAFMVVPVPLASAASFEIRAKWRDCESRTAALSYRTTFLDPARNYGPGKYLIKSEIRWDRYGLGGFWRAADTNTIQTQWTSISNLAYDFGDSHGDRTDWGNLFPERWRAHVKVKLIKNRPGPRDNRVELEERFFNRAMFLEKDGCSDEGVWLP